MNSYLEYQQLDLPWLTSVPAHWEIWKNRRIFTEMKDEVGENSSEYQLLSLSKKGIIPRDMESGKGKFPAKFNKYKIVLPGNMAFCLFDMDETPRTVGLSTETGMLTGAYTIMRVDGINKGYAYYYYLALDDKKALKPLYTGLRKTINVNTFLGTKLPIPPRSEQDQIVRYLDWKTSEIAKFVNEKKKEIKRLTELKNAIISDAMTKGLHQDVPMRNTGIEWLPQIPAHWKIYPLRRFLRTVSKKNRPDLPLLSVVREKGVILRDVDDRTTNHNYVPEDLSGYKVVTEGQFVINKMKAWQGSYGVSQYDGIVSPAYYVFDLDASNKEFFHFAIRSKVYVNFFAQNSGGIRVGQWDLSLEKMKNIPFFLPPEEEQEEILKIIPTKIKEIDSLILGIQQEITLVEELRTKIISDAVTGKVDVRGVEVPDFVLETEDTDEDEDVDADDENEEMEGEE